MQADGFVMSGEHVPLWNRMWAGNKQFNYFRRSYIEAAARLALWEDFDCKSFDAFCVSILGEELNAIRISQGSMSDLFDTSVHQGRFTHTAESHRLLCKWLLCISEELLDPRLGQAQEISRTRSEEDLDSQGWSQMPSESFLGRATTFFIWRMGEHEKRTSAGLTRSSGLQKRFTYFVDKVRPLQIWRDDGGALFLQLKRIAQRLMDGVARACNERYAALVAEPCGRQLAAFCSLDVKPMRVYELLHRTSSLEDDGIRLELLHTGFGVTMKLVSVGRWLYRAVC
jgi:hypothetical protein